MSSPDVPLDAVSTRGRPPAGLHPLARTPEEWAEVLGAAGEPAYRAGQVFRWIHGRGVLDASRMTDLPRALRERLGALGLREPVQVRDVVRSRDGTRKLLLRLTDGALVECVAIPMVDLAHGDDDGADAEAAAGEGRRRVTLCVSTQYGCAMGCVFCASGRAGLVRGLGAAEILAQVLVARRHLDPDEALTNLVFMGMGEPLHFYEETARALRLLAHPEGLGFGPRRVTVSTVGLVPGIRRLGEDFGGKVGLAVSLHAPDDETRSRLLPMNRRWPIGELIAELRRYPLPPRRRITIEYTLIEGVNDSDAHARALVRLLVGLRVKVNLIPMNPVPGSPLRASPRVEAFRALLGEAGIGCWVRTTRGDDVAAACGQLAFAASGGPCGQGPP